MYISLSCDLKGASCMAKRSDSTDFVAKKKTDPNRGFLDSSITNALRLVSGVLLLGWNCQILVQKLLSCPRTHPGRAEL